MTTFIHVAFKGLRTGDDFLMLLPKSDIHKPKIESLVFILVHLVIFLVYIAHAQLLICYSLSLRWHLSKKTGEILKVMSRGADSVMNVLE